MHMQYFLAVYYIVRFRARGRLGNQLKSLHVYNSQHACDNVGLASCFSFSFKRD